MMSEIMNMLKNAKIATMIVLSLLYAECASGKGMLYFGGTEGENPYISAEEWKLRAGDELYMRVLAMDMEAVVPFNVEMIKLEKKWYNYIVDSKGDVTIPILGTVHVAGMTVHEMRDYLVQQLSTQLKQPQVIVNVVNAAITILGAVEESGRYEISGPVTILEAIGMAGGMTRNADMSNVMVVREENGKTVRAKINLAGVEMFESPYYALKKGDVVYVMPK